MEGRGWRSSSGSMEMWLDDKSRICNVKKKDQWGFKYQRKWLTRSQNFFFSFWCSSIFLSFYYYLFIILFFVTWCGWDVSHIECQRFFNWQLMSWECAGGCPAFADGSLLGFFLLAGKFCHETWCNKARKASCLQSRDFSIISASSKWFFSPLTLPLAMRRIKIWRLNDSGCALT